MARQTANIQSICDKIISDARAGVFSPVYLLMGEEPFYPELVCSGIMECCIPDEDRDFNETVCYGTEVSAESVISAARRFPMMSDRQLVVVKEAQAMKDIEQLSLYCASPLDSTVLVILMHGASADKRKGLYKAVQKNGVIVESPLMRDYEMPRWIESYYASRGLRIEPQAAGLLAEAAGTSLATIAAETDKLVKNLPEGTDIIRAEDVERNVGISRQYSIFELTKALSYRQESAALKIASRLGAEARFSMPAATSALYTHFNRILRYGALLSSGHAPSPEQKSQALAGVNPYFYREYDAAVRNYPVRSAMRAISLLCEFDYRGKGGDGDSATPSDLLMELTARLLNL